MKFSRSLKSSAHSLPSPNGSFIATLLPSKLTIRATRSLEIIRVIALPESSTAIQWFIWSASSRRILICIADVIRVFAVLNNQFSATISNPTSGTPKLTYVAFGSTDDEIIAFSEFGLKVTVFKLSSSTSIDINTPKLFQSGSATKGYSYRPRTSHFALLTRSGGKDIVSIHEKDSYVVLRSWNPDTVDSQALSWSPDGRWLAVVESAGQGHKVLIYTADGHLLKVWNGPSPMSDEEKDIDMGAGLRMFEWSSMSQLFAIGDHSPRITVLSTPSFLASLSLYHTTTIRPVDGLQIWQEQIIPSPNGGFDRAYNISTQISCPPTTALSPAVSDSHGKIGTTILSFDASGTLIATRAENMPTAIWIWDTVTKVLKSVLIQHSPVARITWHPSINELLMIRCEGDDSKGIVHVWQATWEAPKIVDFGTQVPEGKIIGKSVARWLNHDSQSPAIFFSDSQDCIIVSISDDEENLPWQDAVVRAADIYGEREESPLNLVPAKEKRSYSLKALINDEPTMTGMTGDSDEVDDTFHFKKFAEP